MKKNSILKKYRDSIMDHGVAHIVFHQSGISDIIHPYSVKGYELLSDEFTAFLEKYRVLIPYKAPVVMEITGNALKEDEKKTIDKALWSHFCLAMYEADKRVKKCLKTCVIFLILTVLSTVFLFNLGKQTSEILINLAYMPFYFFGYRLLIYLLMETVPIWNERNWYRRLASIKLVFSEGKSRSLDEINLNKLSNEVVQYEIEAENVIRGNKIMEEYFMENGVVKISCSVNSIEDLIQIHEIDGREYVSDGLSIFLDQAEPLFNSKNPIEFTIKGTEFKDKEKETVKRAIKNYYGLKMGSEEARQKNNNCMIIKFCFMVFAILGILFTKKNMMNIAFHEFVVMLFWFFGDYLLEFILLTNRTILNYKKKMENCWNMTLNFEDSGKTQD